MGENKINVIQVFDNETIAASGVARSAVIDMEHYRVQGVFSLQVHLSGSGTGRFEYELSNNGEHFLEPASATDIKTGLTAGDGLYSFAPEPARYLIIKATETGTSDAIVVDAWLAVQ